jgi:hypothetical protein
MIMYDIGKKDIRFAFEGHWLTPTGSSVMSRRGSFPNPWPRESDGTFVRCGYDAIPTGSHISPGDDLFRILPSRKARPRAPNGEIWEGDVIISFGLRNEW